MRRLLLGFAGAGLAVGLVDWLLGTGEATLPLVGAALLAILWSSRTSGTPGSTPN
ncbi:MAG: hypothetical protein IT299_13500 [Dehalococcoidia bacterium]|nr:hypothetical protein [Dehalococcoidia bacterium]